MKYSCSGVHDLYLGTSLYTNSGKIAVRLDGDPETPLDLFLQNEPSVNTRRRIRSGVAAGDHSVVIRVADAGTTQSPKYFYFDFLEAAVVGDVPDALPTQTNVSPAFDYSTDHSFKLPPARILWNMDNLGFRGPLNEYIGVFWWNQRKRMGALLPSAKVTFSGQFDPQESIFVTVGGKDLGKTTWWNEDTTTIARHFAQLINSTLVGIWASAEANVLTITCRSPKAAYYYSLAVRKQGTSQGTVSITEPFPPFAASNSGTWQVDPAQTPPLNRGARAWHADMFGSCQASGREIVVAESMELVFPPPGFGAVYADNSIVATDVGFGQLNSVHCSFSQSMRDYQKAVFRTIADLMAGAGLTPNLQFGEFLWWFFTNKDNRQSRGRDGLLRPGDQVRCSRRSRTAAEGIHRSND